MPRTWFRQHSKLGAPWGWMVTSAIAVYLLSCASVLHTYQTPYWVLGLGAITAVTVILVRRSVAMFAVGASMIVLGVFVVRISNGVVYFFESQLLACDHGPFYGVSETIEVFRDTGSQSVSYRGGVLGITSADDAGRTPILWWRNGAGDFSWATQLTQNFDMSKGRNERTVLEIHKITPGLFRDVAIIWIDTGFIRVYVWRIGGVHRYYFGS